MKGLLDRWHWWKVGLYLRLKHALGVGEAQPITRSVWAVRWVLFPVGTWHMLTDLRRRSRVDG